MEDELFKHCQDLQMTLTDGECRDIEAADLCNELIIFRTVNPVDYSCGLCRCRKSFFEIENHKKLSSQYHFLRQTFWTSDAFN
ncbi:hypothetical protein QTP88_015193 [Uroleucon formosanum]